MWRGSRGPLDSRSSLTARAGGFTVRNGRAAGSFYGRSAAARPAPRRFRSIATTAWRNRVKPIGLHGFVGPEIDGDLHRGRQPDELLAEIEFSAGFLEPRETDLEIPRGSRSRSATHPRLRWQSIDAPASAAALAKTEHPGMPGSAGISAGRRLAPCRRVPKCLQAGRMGAINSCVGSPSDLIFDNHLMGGAAGSFTLHIAAAVSAA